MKVGIVTAGWGRNPETSLAAVSGRSGYIQSLRAVLRLVLVQVCGEIRIRARLFSRAETIAIGKALAAASASAEARSQIR
jgi:hypothetical protein